MRVRPVSPESLVEQVADRIAARDPGHRLRVAVDGAEAAGPEALAVAPVDPLRVRGRDALHVPAAGFLRPASVRLTAAGRRWTLPAYARYEAEVAPAGLADVVVRVDDPRHPALVGAG
jgi:hypothetical protein